MVSAPEIRGDENIFHQFVTHTPAPIAMFDKQMRYLMASNRWLTDYNLGDRDIIGKSHYEIFPEIPERWKELHREALSGKKLSSDMDSFKRADGRLEWVRWELRPWYQADGSIGGIMMFTEVITERKAMEDELRRSNLDLAQFASVISHDLREPLRTITYSLQQFENEYRATLGDQTLEYIDYAIDSAKRLQQLILGILEYCKIDGSTGKNEVCDSEAVFQRVLRDMQLLIREKNALITQDSLPKVFISEIHLGLIFQNLLSNALKYHDGKEQLKIVVSCESRGSEAIFSVCDNGIGIDEEFHDSIFMMFQRPHSTTKYPGLGLGLASCKKIIEKAGGKIWVNSCPGMGSTFYFSLVTHP